MLDIAEQGSGHTGSAWVATDWSEKYCQLDGQQKMFALTEPYYDNW